MENYVYQVYGKHVIEVELGFEADSLCLSNPAE